MPVPTEQFTLNFEEIRIVYDTLAKEDRGAFPTSDSGPVVKKHGSEVKVGWDVKKNEKVSHDGPASFLTSESDSDPIALLLPAVQAAREAARSGDGVFDADDFRVWHGSFGPLDDGLAPFLTDGGDGTGGGSRSSTAHLLPYIEQDNLYSWHTMPEVDAFL